MNLHMFLITISCLIGLVVAMHIAFYGFMRFKVGTAADGKFIAKTALMSSFIVSCYSLLLYGFHYIR